MPNSIITTSTSSASNFGSWRNLPRLLPISDLVRWVITGVCLEQRAAPQHNGPRCELFCLNAVLAHRGRLVSKGEGKVKKATVYTFLLVSRAPHTQPNVIILISSPPQEIVKKNKKNKTKPSKLHVATNLSVQKVCHLPKLPPNIFTFQKPHKTAQKCMSTSGLKAIP